MNNSQTLQQTLEVLIDQLERAAEQLGRSQSFAKTNTHLDLTPLQDSQRELIKRIKKNIFDLLEPVVRG